MLPLSTVMIAGIPDVLLISTPQDTPRFQALPGGHVFYGRDLLQNGYGKHPFNLLTERVA